MADTIEGYLADLRSALAGSDPALVQDALYDAEEYLRSAAAESGDDADAASAAIEAYGAPEEVAAAYRDAEMTVAAALRAPDPRPASGNPFARFFGVLVDPRAWGSLFYLLLSLATGVLYFTLVVTGLSLTLGTLVLIIGLPIALVVLAVVRAVSLAEGRLVEGMLGTRMPRRPRTAGVQGNLLERIKGWLTDWRTRTTMLYMLLQLPLGTLYFSLVVTGVATSAAFVGWPIVSLALDLPFMQTPDYAYYIEPWGAPFLVALGLLGFVVTLWVSKGIGVLHAAYAKIMLVGRVEGVSPAQTVYAPGAGAEGGGL